MTIFKVKVAIGSSVSDVDGIEHEGKLWLVPHWIDNPAEGWTKPVRIIRFDILPHEDVRGSALGDYVISEPVPRELFAVETPKRPIAGFEVRELPDIQFPISHKTQTLH